MDPASSERSREAMADIPQKPRMIGTPVFSDRTEFSVTTGLRIRTRKTEPPLPTCRICGCCLRGSAGPVFLTPVNLDSFFAARAPSICAVPSEGPLR